MNSKTIRTSTIAGTAAALLLLGGAAPSQAADAPPPAEGSETCAGHTGDQAILQWGRELEEHRYTAPQLLQADTSTYDPCAEVSWITVPYGESSPEYYAVMLFHNGEYVGTATETPVQYEPDIEHTEDDELLVVFPYVAEDSEFPPNHPDRLVAIFYWYEDGQAMLNVGELPPEA